MIHFYKIHREPRICDRPTFAAIHDDALEESMIFFGAENPDSLVVAVNSYREQASSYLVVDVLVTYDEEQDVVNDVDDDYTEEPPF